jgi:hypothetical protein
MHFGVGAFILVDNIVTELTFLKLTTGYIVDVP